MYTPEGQRLKLEKQELLKWTDKCIEQCDEFAYKQVKKSKKGDAVPFDVPVEQALKSMKCSADMARALEVLMFASTALDYGCFAKNMSSHAVDPLESSSSSDDEEEPLDLFVASGHGGIIKHLSQDLHIKLNQIVSKIDYSQNSAITVTTQDNVYKCDYVLVTVPLGVLKARKIEFVPELPSAKLNAIDNDLVMTNLGKIILEFPSVFWDKDERVLVLVNTNPKQKLDESTQAHYFVNAFAISGKPMLVALTSDSLTRTMEASNDPNVAKEIAMKSLRQMYGAACLEPTSVYKTPWSIDPFTLGSYSVMSPKASPTVYEEMAKPVNNKLFFAGEHTDDENWSTVPGAYSSGEREASRILNEAQKSKQKKKK